MAGRDAASRESVHAHRRPGGARATPPIRHYERIVRMHAPKPEDTRRVRPTSEGFALAGSGPKNRRGGAPRGERPPAAQTVKASLRGDACGPREWSAHITGAAAPERLSALRFPLFVRGKDANLGGDMPRENDDACSDAAASAARIAAPSPRLRGEGCTVLQRREFGEGDSPPPRPVDGPPHPIGVCCTFGAALSPHAGRGRNNKGLATADRGRPTNVYNRRELARRYVPTRSAPTRQRDAP
jgi:hypothetical protein